MAVLWHLRIHLTNKNYGADLIGVTAAEAFMWSWAEWEFAQILLTYVKSEALISYQVTWKYAISISHVTSK